LSCLLTEIDGISSTVHDEVDMGDEDYGDEDLGAEDLNGYVIVVATTSWRENLDEAILRPGRLDHHIYVGDPDLSERELMLRTKLDSMPLVSDRTHEEGNGSPPNWRESFIKELATETEAFSRADIDNLCREAALLCLSEGINQDLTPSHFRLFLKKQNQGRRHI